ncbi:MAG: serine--tRNA ligase, partial [Chromatiales bacterium]
MLDPKRLRNDLDAVIAGVSRRGFTFDRERFESLEARRKELQVRTQDLQNERNSKSRGIGKAKAAGEDIQPLLDAVASLGDELKEAQEKLGEIQHALQQMLLEVPN